MPVTQWDFTPEECIKRLEKVLAGAPLKVTVDGAGVENGPCSMEFDQVALVTRFEIENAIRLLRRAVFTQHADGSPKTREEIEAALSVDACDRPIIADRP